MLKHKTEDLLQILKVKLQNRSNQQTQLNRSNLLMQQRQAEILLLFHQTYH